MICGSLENAQIARLARQIIHRVVRFTALIRHREVIQAAKHRIDRGGVKQDIQILRHRIGQINQDYIQ